jgi:hypothetical protein
MVQGFTRLAEEIDPLDDRLDYPPTIGGARSGVFL